MIQPNELKLHLPIQLSNGIVSTTTKVWAILNAAQKGDLSTIKKMAEECPELLYAQYNYNPPIHFAVRQGHIQLVQFLLANGAHNPGYKSYPFLDSLELIAQNRGYNEITTLLEAYKANNAQQKFTGDNGAILFNRTELETTFEKAVDDEDLEKTEAILKEHPEFVKDETFFWGEGILLFAAKENNRPMMDLLLNYGAKVPDVLKWAQFYYLEHNEGAAYILQKGMNPNTMSWHHVTVLHDMAQKGNLHTAALLVQHGADLNPIDEEYQSTPLGMAARWGQYEMAEYLLQQGADVNKAGAPWATPLAWAKKKKFVAIEELLIRWGAK